MSNLRLVYDQETQHIIDTANLIRERFEVVEQAQRSFAIGVHAIRYTHPGEPKLDALLESMQGTFDQLAAIAKAVVA